MQSVAPSCTCWIALSMFCIRFAFGELSWRFDVDDSVLLQLLVIVGMLSNRFGQNNFQSTT